MFKLSPPRAAAPTSPWQTAAAAQLPTPCSTTPAHVASAPSPCAPAALDDLIPLLQAQDQRRKQILNAIETKAASARPAFASIQNYFETEQRRAWGAHKFK
nr:MAG TPA: hypothetical protein [Caudoviricetes sp.]